VKANIGWPWWVSVLLWFKRPVLGVDYGNKDGDFTVKIYMKELNGVKYIVKTEIIDPNRIVPK
jgi:hypothetical protein